MVKILTYGENTALLSKNGQRLIYGKNIDTW